MNAKYIIAITVTIAAIGSAATALFMHYGDTKTLQPTVAANGRLPTDNVHPQEKESDRLLKAMSLEMEKLRTQVGKLEQQAATGLPKQNAISIAGVEAANVTLSSEDAVRQREALVKAHKGILENSLRQEEKDTQWAENAQAKLSSAYSAATAKGVRFVDADCRSTMCRVEMALDQPGKRGEIQLRTLMDGPTPWPGTRFMQLDKQTGEVVVYMMRENHELPALPPETNNN
jgi:hypothetical protein